MYNIEHSSNSLINKSYKELPNPKKFSLFSPKNFAFIQKTNKGLRRVAQPQMNKTRTGKFFYYYFFAGGDTIGYERERIRKLGREKESENLQKVRDYEWRSVEKRSSETVWWPGFRVLTAIYKLDTYALLLRNGRRAPVRAKGKNTRESQDRPYFFFIIKP